MKRCKSVHFQGIEISPGSMRVISLGAGTSDGIGTA